MTTSRELRRAETFYSKVLHIMDTSEIPFLVGGAFALREYADIYRDTKDLDVFCLPGDYERLLTFLGNEGFETSITDANWLAKVSRGEVFVDLIFNSANGLCSVDQAWFDNAPTTQLLGHEIRLVPPEGIIWTKAFVQDRNRFDGSDIFHIIRKVGEDLNWQRLLSRMDLHWEILLAHILTFRFIYPSERDHVPSWLLSELLERARVQLELPVPQEKVCRGPLLSRHQYEVDIRDWGYEWGFKQASNGK